MIALDTRCKESGLTRGEIRKKTRAAKPVGAPVALTHISACSEKIDMLDFAALDQAQKDAFVLELNKLRSSALKMLNLLKT